VVALIPTDRPWRGASQHQKPSNCTITTQGPDGRSRPPRAGQAQHRAEAPSRARQHVGIKWLLTNREAQAGSTTNALISSTPRP